MGRGTALTPGGLPGVEWVLGWQRLDDRLVEPRWRAGWGRQGAVVAVGGIGVGLHQAPCDAPALPCPCLGVRAKSSVGVSELDSPQSIESWHIRQPPEDLARIWTREAQPDRSPV